MKIGLEDGRVLEIEGNPSPEEIDQIVVDATASAPSNTAPTNTATSTKISDFVPDIIKEIPIPKSLPFGMKASDIEAANAAIRENNAYQESFIGDEERQKLKKIEEERGILSSIGQGLLHVGKQFDAGTKLSPDWMPEGLQKILDYRIGGDNDMSRQDVEAELKKEMGKEASRYAITKMENPIASSIGETIPFLATGAAGSYLDSGARLLYRQQLKDRFIKGATALSGKSETAANIASRLSNKATEIPTAGNLRWRDWRTGIATGAAEGGAQYDQSALGGATSSFLGGLAGVGGSGFRILDKIANERDAPGKALVKEMSNAGLVLTPGVKSGNLTLLKEESGLRNSDRYGQEFNNMVDRPNNRRFMDMAGEAIGLPLKDRDRVSQTELAEHMTSLSNQYKELENTTFGRLGTKEGQEVGNILQELEPTATRNTTKDDRYRFEKVKSIVRQFVQEASTVKTAKGFPSGYTFDGKQYQNMRKRIKDEANQAFVKGDSRLGDNLNKIVDILDDSLLNGMNAAKASQWKDLNERYAMTNILLNNGLTPSGMLDTKGLKTAMMHGPEAKRTLIGQGNRIRKFQDIVRYDDALHGQDIPGGDLTGLGGRDADSKRGVLRTVGSLILDPYKELSLRYRLDKSPLNLPIGLSTGFHPRASIHTARAFSQGGGPGSLLDSAMQYMADEQKAKEEREKKNK